MIDPFSRPVFNRARRLCLALPEASEKTAWGHPTFRIADKTFCAFEMIKGRPTIAFRLPPEMCEALVSDARAFATPYGRGSWVSIWVDRAVNWKEMTTLVRTSYRSVASKRLMGMADRKQETGDRKQEDRKEIG